MQPVSTADCPGPPPRRSSAADRLRRGRAAAFVVLALGLAGAFDAVLAEGRLLCWAALGGMAWLLLQLRQARLDAAALRAQVAVLSQQLAASQARAQEPAAGDAVQAERQRLLRELHDGIGSSLITAAKLLEQRRLGVDEAADLLRDCIDDLRLLIDSAEPANDLASLLAGLRHRLGRRLKRAGLRIDWRVADLPPQPWLGPAEAHEVQRILQEVLANVVKHSGASFLRVTTAQAPDGHALQLSLEDDGRGFDAERQHAGRGLRHMRQRAEQLGAALSVTSSPLGTHVALRLSRSGVQSRNKPLRRAS